MQRSTGARPPRTPSPARGREGHPIPARRRSAAAAALLAVAAALALSPSAADAQTLGDGRLMPARAVGVGVMAAQGRWSEYWEGTRRRDNENIGVVTTRSVTWMAAYGVTDGLTLVASLPYVQTQASLGTLSGMEGVQDLTVGAKLRLLSAPVADRATVSLLAAGSVGAPVGDYTPDFLPMSIGLGARRATGRLTAHAETRGGLFVDATGAYTVRGNVTLDRESYYTEGRLYETREVSMPDVFDYTVTAGFRRGRLHVPLSLTEQRTLGGGDIRRQDMPFVSHRMNFVEVGGGIGYLLPANLMVQAGAGRVVSGRNVGQSTTLSFGLRYMHPF